MFACYGKFFKIDLFTESSLIDLSGCWWCEGDVVVWSILINELSEFISQHSQINVKINITLTPNINTSYRNYTPPRPDRKATTAHICAASLYSSQFNQSTLGFAAEYPRRVRYQIYKCLSHKKSLLHLMPDHHLAKTLAHCPKSCLLGRQTNDRQVTWNWVYYCLSLSRYARVLSPIPLSSWLPSWPSYQKTFCWILRLKCNIVHEV